MFFRKYRVFILLLSLWLGLYSLRPAKAEQVSEVPTPNLTEEGRAMAQKINLVFADAPYMIYVANCESSGLVHRENGQLIKNKAGSSAEGVFQVLMRLHAPQMRKMGLNPNRTDHYLTYVRHLYDEYGLSPWAASAHCWKKHYRQVKRG